MTVVFGGTILPEGSYDDRVEDVNKSQMSNEEDGRVVPAIHLRHYKKGERIADDGGNEHTAQDH